MIMALTKTERELITEATMRVKELLKAKDIKTVKTLWKFCAYIGGNHFDAQVVASDNIEQDMADKINERISEILENYRNAGACRMSDEFSRGVSAGYEIGFQDGMIERDNS